MRPFQYDCIHAWQGQSRILVSVETTKTLEYFKTTDCAINWLYLEGYKEAARALNKHVKCTKVGDQ
jgi:hypothetical protein